MDQDVLETLRNIERATANIATKIGSALYTTGVLIAAGMNHALDTNLAYSLLSWLNVGHLMMRGSGLTAL